MLCDMPGMGTLSYGAGIIGAAWLSLIAPLLLLAERMRSVTREMRPPMLWSMLLRPRAWPFREEGAGGERMGTTISLGIGAVLTGVYEGDGSSIGGGGGCCCGC